MTTAISCSVNAERDRFVLRDLQPRGAVSKLREDVLCGLTEERKTLPPKYFYDARGSQLFARICEVPEYYPTRTERALLRVHADEIVEHVQMRSLVELGSGTSEKTEVLLGAASAPVSRPIHYYPVDVCREVLEDAAARLLQRFPGISITALAGDYYSGLQHLPAGERSRLFTFLGGSIGNFDHDEAVALVSEVSRCMAPEDWFLLGADRVKDTGVLHAAYNDSEGITAEFNLNVLRVLNRELAADFDLDNFGHEAFYNAEENRIEMHLRSRLAQTVNIKALELEVQFARDETIRTEISRKFTCKMLDSLCEEAGMTIERHFQPPNEFFSLVLARKNGCYDNLTRHAKLRCIGSNNQTNKP